MQYIVELIWNHEFHYVPWCGAPHHSLKAAIREAISVVRVKFRMGSRRMDVLGNAG